MPKRIRSITLENFKGATNTVTIDFDPSKPTVLIFGENGTGKSTIVDGVDFICNGRYGSLDDRSVSGSKADLLASLGNIITNLKVSLNYAGDAWTGIIGHGKKPSTTGAGDKPKAKILRRSEILQIVDGQPKERYEALRSFIEVPSTENNEKTLREAIRTIDESLNEAVRSSEQADTQLQDLWLAESMPDKDYTNWGKSRSAADVSSLKKTAEHLSTIIGKMGNCLSAREALQQSKSSTTEAEGSFNKAHNAFEAIKEGLKGYEKDIVNVLQEAKKFITMHPAIDSCPVCEKPNTSAELLKKLDDRLNKMDGLIKAKNALETAKNDFKSRKQIQTTREKDWLDRVKQLAILSRDNQVPEIASLKINWDSFSSFLNSEHENTAERIQLAAQLDEQLLSCRELVEKRKQQLDKDVGQHNAIRTAYETIQKKKKQAEKFHGQLEKLKQLHELMEKERKTYVETELSSISGEVDSLYAKVHPNEGLGKVKFSLDPKYIGSMAFTGEFQGQSDIQPQAYYSESHLDTLGICVFLALAKKYSDENTIVVLDDVITSIDQAHMTRFIQMLHDEAASFNQLIITTHYRPWKDRYKYGGGPSGDVQLIELLHWSHPRGIRHTKAKLSVEELAEHLQEEKYDRQVVSSKAGILLEGMIDHIALCYGCRLPRKAVPDYTLAELMDSINKKLKASLRIQKSRKDGTTTETALESLLDEIASLTWIRNKVGCHFNISGMDIADTDVKQFCELTVGLASALICSDCGELPHRNQSGSYWQCRCGNNMMHPLTMPT